MTAQRRGDAAVRDFLDQTDLHGVVAVLLAGLLLHHEAGSGLDDRDRDERPVLGEHLGHPDLLANDSFDCHVLVFPLGTALPRFMCWLAVGR
jgi:hypothetical protein